MTTGSPSDEPRLSRGPHRNAAHRHRARVNALWLEANAPMYGDAVRRGDDYAWWWLYVPHFVHSPFCYYANAFGELLVTALVGRYDEEDTGFVRRCLEQLRAVREKRRQGDTVTRWW